MSARLEAALLQIASVLGGTRHVEECRRAMDTAIAPAEAGSSGHDPSLVLTNICTTCNNMVDLCKSAICHADEVDAIAMLGAARDAFQRVGMLADSPQGGDCFGDAYNWFDLPKTRVADQAAEVPRGAA